MFVVNSKPALSPTLAQRSTGDHLPTVARIGSHLLSIIVSTICLHTATSYANPRYQAYVGQETIEVQNLGSGGSSNCGSIVPEPAPQYHAGQDVEYIFTNGGVVDITKNGTYYVDVVCYAPMPIDAIMYAYGSSNDDTLNDSDSIGMTVYDGARFYQVLRAGYSQDFVIYVSNESALDRGWTKMMVSQFITKYENGDYGSYGQASTFGVLSPKIGADEIRGGEGNDSLQTSGGNDNLYGESGSDIITDLGEDLDYSKLVGDNDVDPTWNAATLFGGPGDDIFYVRDSKDKIVEYPGEGFDIAFCAYNYDATYPDWIMGKGGYKFTYNTDIEVIAGSCGQLPPNFTGRYFPNLWWQPYEVQSLRGKGTSLSDAISYYESSLIFDAGPADDLVVTGPEPTTLQAAPVMTLS